jgi:hypothetical protein
MANKALPAQPLHILALAASDPYLSGKIESRFSASGKLLFLLARLPRQDFSEKYGAKTLSVVVVNGHVITLEKHQHGYSMHEHFLNKQMRLEFSTDSFGFSSLNLFMGVEKVGALYIGYDTEHTFQFDLKSLRTMAFAMIQNLPAAARNKIFFAQKSSATLHIVPDQNSSEEDENSGVSFQQAVQLH